jgi:outer membrane immunogenic protein
MRKLLGVGILSLGLGATALAADLPMKAAPLAPAPVVAPTWTGLYVGGHIGAGWGTIESDANIAGVITLPVSSHNTNGMLGGLQAGYNYQMGWAVLGIEGAWSWADIKGSTPCLVVFSCSGKTTDFASISARLGAVIGNNALVYVKGGGVWGRSEYTFSSPIGIGIPAVTNSVTRSGYLFGAGAEYRFDPRWSAFVEYNYMDFGTKDVDFSALAGGVIPITAHISERDHLVKVGVNAKIW